MSQDRRGKGRKKYGSVPMFMKSEVSASFLSENPQYRKLFKKCPHCGKYALKPNNKSTYENGMGYREEDVKIWRCRKCDYVHAGLQAFSSNLS